MCVHCIVFYSSATEALIHNNNNNNWRNMCLELKICERHDPTCKILT